MTEKWHGKMLWENLSLLVIKVAQMIIASTSWLESPKEYVFSFEDNFHLAKPILGRNSIYFSSFLGLVFMRSTLNLIPSTYQELKHHLKWVWQANRRQIKQYGKENTKQEWRWGFTFKPLVEKIMGEDKQIRYGIKPYTRWEPKNVERHQIPHKSLN